MRRLSIRSGSSQLPWRSRFLLLNAGASPQRILQIDWHAMLLEQIGKGLVREFLQRHHPVPAQQCQLRPAFRRRSQSVYASWDFIFEAQLAAFRDLPVDRAILTAFLGWSLAARLPPPLIGSSISL